MSKIIHNFFLVGKYVFTTLLYNVIRKYTANMLLKLFLLKLFLRVKKLSEYLNLLCQIAFICLNILVETDDSGGGKNETDQEDSVEEFCDLDDGGEIDDVALSAMPKSQQNMFKCSQCENCFISLTYLSQHENSLHLKMDEDCSKENEYS